MNRVIMFLSITLCCLISSQVYAQIAESGTFQAKPGMENYKLDEGKINGKSAGERKFNYEVRFSKKFSSKPEVICSVSSIDANASVNIRYKIEPKYVSSEGFVISIITWGDSEIYAIEGNWMAVSE